MENKRLELVFFSVIFIGLLTLTFFVFRPFLPIIILAAVLSVLFHPLYQKIVKTLHGGNSFVACFLVIIALIFLIIPIIFFGLQILQQAQNFFFLAQSDKGQYIQVVQQNVDTFVRHVIPSFSFNVSDILNKALTFISVNLGGLLSQTTYILFQTLLLLFTFFFLLRDGEKIFDSIVFLSPFEKAQNKEIADSVYRTITAVIRGILFVGVLRFALISAAFYLFGIPNAILWGSIGGIIGMVPGLGTPFVIIPTFIYLLFYGNIFLAIGMLLFGVLISIFIDNMLSAYFFGKGLNVPSFFVLFSILGGIMYFGPLGFIFGPIILSLFISLVDMYKILILKKK